MEIDEKVLSEVITKIVQATLNSTQKTVTEDNGTVKVVDPSGIIKIDPSNTQMEQFEVEGVELADLTTLEEAPRMGIGIMGIDHSALEWTLTYDEFDIVLEGELEIEIDGRVLNATPGQAIYIPKGSHIHFQTPSAVKYLYTVYPANWAELC